MPWRKSPPGLVDLFEQAVPRRAGIERRQMFGYPRTVYAEGKLTDGATAAVRRDLEPT
jgi:hypothetical protein